MRNTYLYILFLIFIIGDLAGEALGIKGLDYSFKPTLLLWITAYFSLNAKHTPVGIKRRILPAFLFSWLGDVLLMFTQHNSLFFIFGLLSFLTAHIFYILLFYKTNALTGKKAFITKRPFWIVPFVIYGICVYGVLFTHLNGVMKIAVFIYIVAILTMAAMALNRHGNAHSTSFRLVMFGSLLFVLSDTMIAYNQFVAPIYLEGILVMATYIAAQYLIMRGILWQFEITSNKI